jgi:hypothetical protein
MATVRHLGLFSLPNIALGTEADFLARRNRCAQPASEFDTTTLDGIARAIAPASLPQSTYTAVSLSRALLWLWRVKTFSVSALLTVEDANFDTTLEVSIGPHNVPNRPISFSQEPMQSERTKVCDCGLFYAREQSPDFEDLEIGSYEITVRIAELQSMWSNYPTSPAINVGGIGQRVRVDFDNNEFYVPVSVGLLVQGGDSLFSYTSGSTTQPAAQGDGPLSWRISDALGSISRNFRFGSTNASGEILIEATEYWPYDPEDGGGPIYDSTTGAQLRDFPAR